jgi:ribosomal protein S19
MVGHKFGEFALTRKKGQAKKRKRKNNFSFYCF